jgi:hypothetical protein
MARMDKVFGWSVVVMKLWGCNAAALLLPSENGNIQDAAAWPSTGGDGCLDVRLRFCVAWHCSCRVVPFARISI